MIFCGKRLRDFWCEKLFKLKKNPGEKSFLVKKCFLVTNVTTVTTVLWRGCMIFLVERLRDFFLEAK